LCVGLVAFFSSSLSHTRAGKRSVGLEKEENAFPFPCPAALTGSPATRKSQQAGQGQGQ